MTRISCLPVTSAVCALALSVLILGSAPTLALAQITYGTLDNFDVINDTGGQCHGFEIELEGISAADVAYTFGAPYQRYGDPVIVPTATGVIIRYAASYDAGGGTWSATTPFTAPPYLPTQGHSCWTGGVADPAEYYNSGCDHFGASLNAAPTKTTYRWLIQGALPGTLVTFGTNVPLPTPVWNVTPPAPGAQPIAAAAIVPPPLLPGGDEFGEAMWVKVFVTELPEGLHADDLDHMVIDDPNEDIVPDEPIEVEIEWVLLQASTENEGEQEFGGGAEVGEGNDAVSRRFEFYRYAGVYDAETHEARCDNPLAADQQIPERCGDPDANGVAGVGELIGAQNVAINLGGPLPVANSVPVAAADAATTAEDVALVVSPATLLGNDTDADNDLLSLVSVQNAVGGAVAIAVGGDVVFTPSADFNGAAGFAYTAADGHGGESSALVSVAVSAVNDAPVANAGPDQSVRMKSTVAVNASASSDVDGDGLTYTWTLVAPRRSRAVLSDATSAAPTFVADRKGTYVLTLVVHDGTVSSVADTVSILARTGK